MTAADAALLGHYSIVFSPDDRGYYAELWWNGKTSRVYANRIRALAWARKNGGTVEHRIR